MTDHAAIQAALARLWPALTGANRFQPIGEGFSSVVLRAPDNMVVRVPTSEAAARRGRIPAHVLPRIADRVPVDVPLLLRVVAPSAGLPWGALAYRYLPGKELPDNATGASLAWQVGVALAAIHAIDPVSAGIDLSILPDGARVAVQREAVMAIALPYLRETQPGGTIACITAWWDAFQHDQAACRYAPIFVHGDFWYGNLLVDLGDRQLTGILDWENAAYDDPAQDLATLLHSSRTFARLAQVGYVAAGGRIDDSILERRDRLWAFRDFRGLAMSLQARDDAETRDALRKLEAGPLCHCFDHDR